jgi:cephalosporin hydroxylase
MYKRIDMIEGSSINPHIAEQVYSIAKNYNKILVCLDSNHTHDHVLEELKLYTPIVSLNSYCVVFDTIVEFLPENYMPDGRPWNPGNNPMTAVKEFISTTDNFIKDDNIDNKLLISVSPSGYLKKVK